MNKIIVFLTLLVLIGCTTGKPESKKTELKGWGYNFFEALKGEFKGQGNIKDDDESEWYDNLIKPLIRGERGNDYEI